MDWLKELIKENAARAVFAPFALSGMSFLGNLILALRDGIIDENEFHVLFTSANGLETAILGLIMVALKVKK